MCVLVEGAAEPVLSVDFEVVESGGISDRSGQWAEGRRRVGVMYDQVEARRITEASIRKEAAAKNRPADLRLTTGGVAGCPGRAPFGTAWRTRSGALVHRIRR